MNSSSPLIKAGMAATLLLIPVLAVLLYLGSTPSAPELHGNWLPPGDPAFDFTLTAPDGSTVSLSDFRGRFVLLFFGYASCPAVCPSNLAQLRKAKELLGAKAEDLQVIMITVDPERDTADELGLYMAHFDPDFLGLTGSPEQISEVVSRYGIYVERREVESALGYLVDHTASTLLLDREARLRMIFPYGTTAEELASDLGAVLQR